MCCYLISSFSSLPTALFFILFFIPSGLSDAVVVSWLVKHQSVFCFFFLMLRLSWLMLHLWWVLFCFVLRCRFWDCCAERRISGVFLIFFFKSQQLFFINHRSVTQSKKMIQQCIFFTDIYLLVNCMCFFFVWFILFLCVLLFCGGQTGLKVEEYSLIGVLHCVQKAKYCIQPSH